MLNIMNHGFTGGVRRAALGLGAISLALGAAQAQAQMHEDLFCSMDGPVFADDRIHVRTGGSIVGVDDEATHVLSNGKVRLRWGALIEGDVTASKVRVRRGSEITGNVIEESAGVEMADVRALVRSYRYNNDNHHVPRTENGRQALRGRHLRVGWGDRLVLPAGDYYLSTLKLRRGATLELAGAVRIYMDRGLVEVGRGRIVGADAADLSIVVARQGFINAHGESGFHASVYAPHALLRVTGKGVASGSVVVDRMWVSDGAEFVATDLCMDGPPVLEEDPETPPEDPGTPPEDPPYEPEDPGTLPGGGSGPAPPGGDTTTTTDPVPPPESDLVVAPPPFAF